ncbi:MAG: SUMF1/EgtB/PvdO family nonheme iron enzyme [Planctomycetia bacterium]|nr:SUMF1/EgtB/PvdO family nonheme iron enzyme [Planctomycetia bacterium]
MWDANLAVARAAVARGLVRARELRELAPLWLGEAPRELGDLLVERGLLSPTAADSLRSDTAGSAATLITPDPGSALDATRVVSGGGRAEPAAAPPPTGDRFTLGREIGSGGLGRVVEAADRDLGRTVALKLAHPGSPGHAMERFRAEARITGRLEHPNIVPVHEMGELPTREVYFCMKRIVGRNMQEVIRSGQWRLRRLVEAFREVCRAVAYAHSRGVIHRDLKPANVMLGDFGETLVVDWGLAKERGAAEAQAASGGDSDAVRQSGSTLTLAGDVLGTPSYMPPEQARGKVEDVDERSDVYALGATLYEILARRPPFLGKTQLEILLKVIEEEPAPPAGAPPELAAIALRALAKKKQDRFPSAAALEEAVEAWLEGTLERERRGRLAEEQVSEALASLDRWRQLRAEARTAALRAKDLKETVKPSAGAADKRDCWAAEDRARALEDEAIGAFSAANAALSGALGNAPEHAGARRLRAQLFWERFLEAEEAGDAKGALLNRRLAERFNDGSLDAALRGEGTLSVTARAYGCRCLLDGRDVAPDELVFGGHHLWSGRRVDDGSDDRERGLEPVAPLRLRVHGPSCRAAEIAGADVWAFQYVEQDRVLVPITPAHPRTRALANPPPALDALFGNSPYRPAGPGLYLGRTPLAPRPFPMGSWLLVVAADGFEPARVPVEIRRQGDAAPAVTLFRPGEIPAAFLPVRAGEFAWQGDPGYNDTAPGELRTLDDLLLARFPVTCREYSAFLGALPVAEASKRAPRESPGHAASWAHDGKGWPVPTAAWKASAAPELAARTKPLAYAGLDWEEEWPVFGVDWTDAAAYARWAAAREGRVLCLPHEEWWEKGARGPRGRAFPWGPAADPSFSNTNVSQPVSMRVSPVDSFPLDESCYGIRGMGGNVQQWMLNENLRAGRRWQMIRGVSWPQSQGQARSCIRTAATREYVNFTVGLRLAAAVRLGG